MTTETTVSKMLITPRDLFRLVGHFEDEDIEDEQAQYEEDVEAEIEEKREQGVVITDGGEAQWPDDCVDTHSGPMDMPYLLVNIVIRDEADLEIDGYMYNTEGLPEDGYYILGENNSLFGPLTDDSMEPIEIKPIPSKT